MSKPKEVTWNGKWYGSITDAARAIGISVDTLRSRIKKGYKRDADLGEFTQPKPGSWNGIEYPSCVAMANDLGISPSAARRRLQKGWSRDSDIPHPRDVSEQVQQLSDSTIQITLTRGYTTIIDSTDADLAAYRWHAMVKQKAGADTYVLVQRNTYPRGRHRMEILSRVILGRMLGRELSRYELADHVDGNPLNNRRNNLRLSTNGQNRANSKVNTNSRSGLKGVYQSSSKRWRARITLENKDVHLGTFDTKEEAHAAYCEAAKLHFGEFARFE